MDQRSIVPEAIFPEQFFDGRKLSGEQKLLLAIIAEAIVVLARAQRLPHNAEAQRLAREAREWIAYDVPGPGHFSLQRICSVFGVDVEYARKGMLQHVEAPAAFDRRNVSTDPADVAQEIRGILTREPGLSLTGLHQRLKGAWHTMRAAVEWMEEQGQLKRGTRIRNEQILVLVEEGQADESPPEAT